MADETIGALCDRLTPGEWTALPKYGLRVRRWPDPPEPRGGCTGLTARWCPVHGDCICHRPDSGLGGDLADPQCPLHSSISTHAASDTDSRPTGGDS